ncbi:YdcH family protein [Acidithiobacillus sp. M4-SHS-6]|uniref:YdcH family protein n=1 Tax=Acidithiobacillus sp. M4-SHS-6 TaxID=3383024 RepID=UPI0039BDACE4
MLTEHQDLKMEFPGLTKRMDQLLAEQGHFAKLYAEFNSLTAEIEHIERNDAATGSQSLEEMKKKRLLLKDEIYSLLTAG